MSKSNVSRPTWDQYFLFQALITSLRASCERAKHGAVIVGSDHTIVATGYNGAPSQVPHCGEAGCDMIQGHCLRCRHAEVNAVIQGLLKRPNMDGLTVYVTGTPCSDCARTLKRERVGRVVYGSWYGKTDAPAIFDEAGIQHELIEYKTFLPQMAEWLKKTAVGKDTEVLDLLAASLHNMAEAIVAPDSHA